MSIAKPNNVLCSASIPMNQVAAVLAGSAAGNAAPATINAYASGCSLARTGVGVFLLTVDGNEGAPVWSVHAIASAIVAANVACVVSIVHTSDAVPNVLNAAILQSTWTITTSATLGGAGADIVGQLNVTLLQNSLIG